MRIKKFKNLWTMGLILTGSILVVFYIIKLIWPQFIVGVAELPSIIKIGTFIDAHLWSRIIFTFISSFLGGYFYYCACYRKIKLDYIELLSLIGFTLFSYFVQYGLENIYTPYNYVVLIFQPFIVLYIKKQIKSEYLISICLCFTIDIMSQALSICIRDVVVLSNNLNSATLFVLFIDGYIWRILLYLFFNYKNKKEN